MFWNLCKFEFRSNCRTYFLMYAVLLSCAIVLSFSNIESLWSMSFMSMAFGLVMIVYVATILTVWILCFVNIVRGYLNSMYKKEAYLTHTLPVATWQLLTVKLLFSIIWLSITSIVVFVSVMIMMANLSGVDLGLLFERLFTIDWQYIEFDYLFSYLFQMLVEVSQGVMLFYFAINLVHSCYIQRYRFPIALAFVFVFGWLQSYVTFKLTVGTSFPDLGEIWVVTIFDLILFVLLFAGSVFFIDHKMEVE